MTALAEETELQFSRNGRGSLRGSPPGFWRRTNGPRSELAPATFSRRKTAPYMPSAGVYRWLMADAIRYVEVVCEDARGGEELLRHRLRLGAGRFRCWKQGKMKGEDWARVCRTVEWITIREAMRRIEKIRGRVGMSHVELSERIGCSSQTLCSLKAGKHMPNHQTLHRLKTFLGIISAGSELPMALAALAEEEEDADADSAA